MRTTRFAMAAAAVLWLAAPVTGGSLQDRLRRGVARMEDVGVSSVGRCLDKWMF